MWDLPLSACTSCPGRCEWEIFYNTFLTSTNDGLQIKHSLYRFIVEYVTVLISICKHKPWSCFGSFQRLCPSFCSAVVRHLQYLRWTSETPMIWDGFWKHRIKMIQITSSLEESCMNDCSEWHVPYIVFTALLPAHGKLVKVYLRTPICATPLPAASSHKDKGYLIAIM